MSRPLYVLPGIGADARLFDAQRNVREIRVIEWIPPAHAREPLVRYAARLAHQLPIDEPFDLGGTSFGGMVALELARHRAPRNVFLFGSCRSAQAVAPTLRALRWLVPLLPARALHPPAMLRPFLARWFGARSPADVALFASMLAATPPSFIRWAAFAVLSWQGAGELPMPVHHIHGDRDRVIPVRRVRADLVVRGAGHLLTLTHADEVHDFLARVP